ncbi:hypothetical protein ACFWJT_10925 [Streptomyces sp. NPDC127069]|uniref:hypothetical protein n=1 Tax=Streptomyces sp. NPDC127069 TaxID=3347128 RepID=UPI0036603D68
MKPRTGRWFRIGIGLLPLPGSGATADLPGVLSGVAAGASFGVYIAAVPDRFAAWERDALAQAIA